MPSLPTVESSFPFIHMSTTVILLMVRVPVLSEARRVTVPRVSTAVRSFTSTLQSLSLIAAKVRSIVTVAGNPWGTKETKIPAFNKTKESNRKPVGYVIS